MVEDKLVRYYFHEEMDGGRGWRGWMGRETEGKKM